MSIPRSKYYLDDDDLYYEIILPKGKGQLTPKCLSMLLLIGKKFMITKINTFWLDRSMADDYFQQGMLMLLNNWQNFNEKKYDKALPLYDRGIQERYDSRF